MTAVAAPAFSGEDLARRARARLTFDLPAGLFTDVGAGDGLRPAKAAAVLVPVVDRRPDATVLLTLRVAGLRAHAGQIAFPGGRIDPGDVAPLAAALREAHEEVGLEARHVTPLGYLDPVPIGTGYLVVPAVAVVAPPFRLTLNPDEVAEAFEVPLAFLMEPGNHQRRSRDLGGVPRSFYAMPYAERNIWGATANMLRNLYDRLYAP